MSTIYEVAKRAGVSTATVSRVLSRPGVVAPETRKKVLREVERLGFTPNFVAANLRSFRTWKLLVTVPDISNPFFSRILQGIEDAAQRRGYAVLLGDTQHDTKREERYALMLKRKEADGLIFLGHRLPKEAASLIKALSPLCAPIVNGCEFSPRLGVPSVHIDNAKAAAEAMAHLYRLGHRRIGVITGPLESPLSRDRLRGTKAQAASEGEATGLLFAQGDFSIGSGVAMGDYLLGQTTPPTAIFCFNDGMAVGVIQAAKRRGRRIPDELSVIGFDDIQFAGYTDPPLTTVAQPMREIGEGTVRLLLEIIEGKADVTPVSITLPHTLMIRGSTAPTLARADRHRSIAKVTHLSRV